MATFERLRCQAERARGFTALELLLATAITAILASVAYPTFADQLARARRVDAVIALSAAQQAEERWRANRTTYGSLADIGISATSSAGHYVLQVVGASATGYQILASAQGAQSRDATCRHLRVGVVGANLDYASGPDATVANAGPANRRCWSL